MHNAVVTNKHNSQCFHSLHSLYASLFLEFPISRKSGNENTFVHEILRFFFSLNSSLMYNHVSHGEKLKYNENYLVRKVIMKNYIGPHHIQCPQHALRENN